MDGKRSGEISDKMFLLYRVSQKYPIHVVKFLVVFCSCYYNTTAGLAIVTLCVSKIQFNFWEKPTTIFTVRISLR